MSEKKLNKDEASILTYLETCLVDSRGNLQPTRMNDIDWKIMEEWKAKGLIDFGRRSFKDIKKYPHGVGGPKTHWVRFTNQAWELAHKCRQERGERHVDTLEDNLIKEKMAKEKVQEDDRSLQSWTDIILGEKK